MSLRLILIHFIYRVIFGIGIAALLWVGGQLLYAMTHQLYAMSEFKPHPGIANSMADIPLWSSPPLQSGDLVGRLDNPERGLSLLVLEGVEVNTLGVATGRVPETPLPGSDGNLAPAAHRDTFFCELRNIHVGGTIRLSTPRGTFGYVVTTTEIVDPSETRVLESRGDSELTLITCYPYPFVGPASQRFIVHARHPVEVKN